MILAIAAAFVAGSIGTGTIAYAGDDDDDGGNAIVDALNQIAIAIQGIDPTVNVDPTPVNVNVDPTPVTLNVDPTPVTLNVDPTPVTINAPQGDKGDKGDKGDTGAKGDKGDKGDPGTTVLDVYPLSNDVFLTPGQFKNDIILGCDAGDILLSGGFDMSNKDVIIYKSSAIFFGTDWNIIAENPSTFDRRVTISVLCFNQSP